MSTPGVLDLSIYRGDTYAHALTFYSDEAQTTEIDLSGRTYAAQIRHAGNAVQVVGTITVDTTDADDGVLVLRLTAAESGALVDGSHRWDLQETSAGVVTTVLGGTATVASDVTQL